jgi:hypothetical protein
VASFVNRLLFGIITATSLIVLVVALLGFADAWSIQPGTRCFEAFATSQFPKWIGCTMAAHEGLAGGLIGAAGALFAAWLAFSGIQRQISEERLHRERTYEEAKEVASVVLAQPVHAAAATLCAINKSLAAEGMYTALADDDVQLAIRFLDGALNNFSVREVVRELRAEERMVYVAICATLATLVDISKAPGRKLGRQVDLMKQQKALMNVRVYLRAFSTELADVYDRDAGLSPEFATVSAVET